MKDSQRDHFSTINHETLDEVVGGTDWGSVATAGMSGLVTGAAAGAAIAPITGPAAPFMPVAGAAGGGALFAYQDWKRQQPEKAPLTAARLAASANVPASFNDRFPAGR